MVRLERTTTGSVRQAVEADRVSMPGRAVLPLVLAGVSLPRNALPSRAWLGPGRQHSLYLSVQDGRFFLSQGVSFPIYTFPYRSHQL